MSSALLMLMSHVKKHVMEEYWLMNDVTSIDTFNKYMPRDRFLNMLSFLHFPDFEDATDDPLWKLRAMFNLLKERFVSFFHPFQKVIIDESLLLFHGRLRFRQ